MRSSLRDLQSTPEVGSEEPSKPETLVWANTSTFGPPETRKRTNRDCGASDSSAFVAPALRR
jgi:hypothetical protein